MRALAGLGDSSRLTRTGFFGLTFAITILAARPFHLPDGTSPWFPAAGVLLAWLMIDGVFAVPFAVSIRLVVALVLHATPGSHALGTEVTRSVAIVVIYFAASKAIRRSAPNVIGLRLLTAFGLIGVVTAPLIAAFTSAWLDHLADDSYRVLSVSTRAFFVGDAIGVIALAPLVLALTGRWQYLRSPVTSSRDRLEAAAQTALLVTVPLVSTGADIGGLFFVVLMIGFLPLVWIAVRRDALQVSVGVVLSTTGVAVATKAAIARGPYDPLDLLTVQTFMLTAALVTWFVSTARFEEVGRRRQLDESSRRVDWSTTHHLSGRWLNRPGLARASDQSSDGSRVMVVDVGVPRETLGLLGTQFAEQVLDMAADRLVTALGPDAAIARLDDSILGAVVPFGSGRLEIDAPRILSSLAGPCAVSGVGLRPAPRVGLSDPIARGEEAIEQALFAIHVARRRRASALAFDDELEALAGIERSRLAELQRGLDHGEIVAWFQPIVRTSDRQIIGVEALARWLHPRLGVMAAGDFIPAAESSGLIGAVGRTVRASTLEYAAFVLPLLGDRPFRFSINVSAAEFGDDLVDELLTAIQHHDVDPSRIMVEITESMAIADVESAQEILTRLRRSGMNVAIDDFGTGQSSMAQLQALPFDELKIDARFVRGLPAVRDLAIVRSIQGLADEFRLGVVAEGVENEEQFDALVACNVTQIQGFLTGRPMPGPELTSVLGALPDR